MFNDDVSDALCNVLGDKYHTNIVSINQLSKLVFDHAISSIFVDNQIVLMAFSVAFTNACEKKTSYCCSVSDY